MSCEKSLKQSPYQRRVLVPELYSSLYSLGSFTISGKGEYTPSERSDVPFSFILYLALPFLFHQSPQLFFLLSVNLSQLSFARLFYVEMPTLERIERPQ